MTLLWYVPANGCTGDDVKNAMVRREQFNMDLMKKTIVDLYTFDFGGLALTLWCACGWMYAFYETIGSHHHQNNNKIKNPVCSFAILRSAHCLFNIQHNAYSLQFRTRTYRTKAYAVCRIFSFTSLYLSFQHSQFPNPSRNSPSVVAGASQVLFLLE